MLNPTAKKKSLVIHGHFYQPPRENPWTQSIPLQDNAKPFHDWNERITAECYNPNTRSRVLDPKGKVTSIVNNFTYINFNIGPTLFAWLEKYHPDTYARILEADRKSCENNAGHGNAIAQVYNHIIMPLANARDKQTQILWGTREFKHRYGREPESIWLAETAINQETVECLINHGIKYVILSPSQAFRVREIGGQIWHDVSHNTIDTTQPYRIFLRTQGKTRWQRVRKKKKRNSLLRTPPKPRYLDVFFYDDRLSTEISFNHLLQDANTFVHRLHEAANQSSAPHVLVHASTDGEIYGHHEPFADMCLASAITSKLPDLQFEITNYGRYLEMHPTKMEVELKPGSEHDEGTAWSCSHGVGRWYRDCGCSIVNNPGWNQQWRTPLRKGFDVLRDGLSHIFDDELKALLRDPWAARDEYIECILNPSDTTMDNFLKRHQKRPLNEKEQAVVLCLMEAQKYSMFTYTSCAWFFDDISGVEIIQNMRFAARAIQLIEGARIDDGLLEIGSIENLEALVFTEFEKARSNIPSCGTGKDIYLKYAKPDIYTPERAANQFLLEKLIEQAFHGSSPSYSENTQWTEESRVYLYAIHCPECVKSRHVLSPPNDGPLPKGYYPEFAKGVNGTTQNTTYSGILEISDVTTRQTWRLLFISFMKRSDHPVSYLKRVTDDIDWEHFASFLSQWISPGSDVSEIPLQEFEHALEEKGFTRYGLTDLYEEDRERLFYAMVQRGVERLDRHLQAIYEDSCEFLVQLAALNVGIPVGLRAPVEFALSYQLRKEIQKMDVDGEEPQTPTHLSAELEKLLQISNAYHIELDKSLLQKRVSGTLNAYLEVLSQQVTSLIKGGRIHTEALENALCSLRETLSLLEQAEKLGMTLDITEAQNITYDIFEDNILQYLSGSDMIQSVAESPAKSSQEYELIRLFLVLMERLNFNVDTYRGKFNH